MEIKPEDAPNRVRYILTEVIDYTEEKFSHRHVSGAGKAAKFEDVSIGWYVRLVGSNESFFVSETEPDFHAGDKVKITLEKIE